MESAIRCLETKEDVLKDILHFERTYQSVSGERIKSLEKELREVQTALLVLNALEPLVEIGKINFLKDLKK